MFSWPPEHKDLVRRNFEKRGSAKMVQLMQDARRNLDHKPTWMEECVWAQLKAHWESSKYKRISEINKRNSESMADASLHTGGSIPHRLHWKRMVLLVYYYVLYLVLKINNFNNNIKKYFLLITEGDKWDRSIHG